LSDVSALKTLLVEIEQSRQSQSPKDFRECFLVAEAWNPRQLFANSVRRPCVEGGIRGGQTNLLQNLYARLTTSAVPRVSFGA